MSREKEHIHYKLRTSQVGGRKAKRNKKLATDFIRKARKRVSIALNSQYSHELPPVSPFLASMGASEIGLLILSSTKHADMSAKGQQAIESSFRIGILPADLTDRTSSAEAPICSATEFYLGSFRVRVATQQPWPTACRRSKHYISRSTTNDLEIDVICLQLRSDVTTPLSPR